MEAGSLALPVSAPSQRPRVKQEDAAWRRQSPPADGTPWKREGDGREPIVKNVHERRAGCDMWLEVNMTRDGLAQGAGCRSVDRTSTRLPVKTERLGEETRGNRMASGSWAEVEVELEDTGDGRSWAPTLQFHYVSPASSSQERGSRLAMRRLVKKVRGPRVTRFSPREMLTLAQEAARRVGPLYGHGGALANAATRRRAWAEIAHAVRAHSIFPRTRDQCRRRWDDLRRWAKRKALRAAGSAELTGIKRLPVGVVLTRPEELALGTFPELSMEGLAVWDVGWSARSSVDRGNGAEPPAMVAAGADSWPDEKAVDLLVLGPVAPLVGGPLHYAAAKSTEEGADESSSIPDVERRDNVEEEEEDEEEEERQEELAESSDEAWAARGSSSPPNVVGGRPLAPISSTEKSSVLPCPSPATVFPPRFPPRVSHRGAHAGAPPPPPAPPPAPAPAPRIAVTTRERDATAHDATARECDATARELGRPVGELLSRLDALAETQQELVVQGLEHLRLLREQAESQRHAERHLGSIAAALQELAAMKRTGEPLQRPPGGGAGTRDSGPRDSGPGPLGGRSRNWNRARGRDRDNRRKTGAGFTLRTRQSHPGP
ncbi:uncharacterized protein LOC116958496 isoform X2 [Petromyzon marinus]|uniref:uncharacterized protein LOC116958496 isoform X2 n=1 Tax=Petromyzon marinus TaxID=7757 RepID=UPI003F6F10EA